ncbi:hypothetical protein C8R43DRAFT_1039271 [Mycena crocata]|nr:hypothetical protein C8R43DRAFT_1039271 [Mycena crocata]
MFIAWVFVSFWFDVYQLITTCSVCPFCVLACGEALDADEPRPIEGQHKDNLVRSTLIHSRPQVNGALQALS